MNFSKKIKKLRSINNYSPKSFAKELDVKEEDVKQWENNSQYPDVVTLLKIKTILHVSLDDLFDDSLSIDQEGNFVSSKSIQKSDNSPRNMIVLDDYSDLEDNDMDQILNGIMIDKNDENLLVKPGNADYDSLNEQTKETQINTKFFHKNAYEIAMAEIKKQKESLAGLEDIAFEGEED